MAIQIDEDKCTICGTCIENCIGEALHMDNDNIVVDPELCIECGACMDVCPADAPFIS